MKNYDTRGRIIQTCRKMNALGLNHNTSGNISVRTGETLLITPTGMDYDLMQPNDIVEMNFDGSFDGDIRPSGEWRFHRDILKNRKDVEVVIHTHSMFCTTIAVYGKPIPAVHYMVTTIGGDEIRCAPFVTPTTQELSEVALVALDERYACLLANHGVITIGRTLSSTLARLVEVENLAALYWRTLAIGDPPVLTADQLKDIKAIMSTYGQQPSGQI